MAPSKSTAPAAARPGRISLKDELAMLENPAPKDFDPEAMDGGHPESDDDEMGDEEDANAGREHYVAVGKSKLRKSDPIPLDPKYKGAKVSRSNIFNNDDDEDDDNDDEDDSENDEDENEGKEEEDDNDDNEDEDDFDINSSDIGAEGSDDEIDSDEAFGEDDEGKEYTKFKFSGSRTTKGGKPPKKGDKITGSSDEDDEDEEEEEEDDEDDEDDESEGDQEDENDDEDDDDEEGNDSDSGSDSDSAEATRRAELRKLMAQEQTTTVDTLTAAARADIDKGIAVRSQQATFDSLLGTRIKLQKALVAVNSLPLVLPNESSSLNAANPSWKDAESAAVKLWEALTDMRVNITNAVVPSRPIKRKRADTDDTDAMYAHMSHLDDAVAPWRAATVDKWAAKTQPTSILPPPSKRLNNAAVATRAPLSAQLATHLQDMPRLVKRTRVPRAAAPLQSAAALEQRKRLAHNSNHSTAAVAPTVIEDPAVFDDTDFYQLLLKALVDARMASAATAGVDGVRWSAAIKASKRAASAVVDTKASKGRKLRYHVHEKLQNFMAREERSLKWEGRQVEDLFAGLLGQRRKGGASMLDEEDSEEEHEDGMDVDQRRRDDDDEMDVGADGLRLFG